MPGQVTITVPVTYTPFPSCIATSSSPSPSSTSGLMDALLLAPNSILIICTFFSSFPSALAIPSCPRISIHFVSLKSFLLTPFSKALVINLTAACVTTIPCIIVTSASSGSLLFLAISFTLVVQFAPFSFDPNLSGSSNAATLITCSECVPPIALVVGFTPGSCPSSTTRFARFHFASSPSPVHTSSLAVFIQFPIALIVSTALSACSSASVSGILPLLLLSGLAAPACLGLGGVSGFCASSPFSFFFLFFGVFSSSVLDSVALLFLFFSGDFFCPPLCTMASLTLVPTFLSFTSHFSVLSCSLFLASAFSLPSLLAFALSSSIILTLFARKFLSLVTSTSTVLPSTLLCSTW